MNLQYVSLPIELQSKWAKKLASEFAVFPAVFDQDFEQVQQKYSVPFLEASYLIMVPQLVDQSLLLFYYIHCEALSSQFFFKMALIVGKCFGSQKSVCY